MPQKITRSIKRISRKIKATLKKRRVVRQRIRSIKPKTASSNTKRNNFTKPIKKTLPPPKPLTSTTLRPHQISQLSLTPYRPYWFIAQWRLAPQDLEIYRVQSFNSDLILRLYSTQDRCVQTISIPRTVRNWHLYTDSDAIFYLELGFLNKKKQFVRLCRSNPSQLPSSKTSKKILDSNPVQFSFTPVQQKWMKEHVTLPEKSSFIYGGS